MTIGARPSPSTGTALLSTGVRMHHYEAGAGDDVAVPLHGRPQTGWVPMFPSAFHSPLDLPETFVAGWAGR